MQDIKTQEQKTKLQKNRVPVDKIEKKTIVEKKQPMKKVQKEASTGDAQKEAIIKKERRACTHLNRLVKVAAFLLIFVLTFSKLSEVLAFKNASYEANNYYSFDYLYDLPKDSLDVVYVGTSQYHMGITPLEIWKEYGITGGSFNVAQCRAWMAYYMIQEVLKYQNPKVIVLDAAVPRGGDNNIIASRRAINQFRFSLTKFQALYDCLELEGSTIDEMINKSFEFFSYHDTWDSLEKADFTDDISSLAYQKGYLLTTKCMPYSDMAHSVDQKPTRFMLDEKTVDYMGRIKALCDEKGVDLIIAKLPSDMWNITYSGMVGRWAKANEVEFLDLTQKQFQRQLHFDNETCYFDENHLNHVGAEIVSNYLGNYLTEHYQFESHSQEIEDAWNTDYEAYEAYRDFRILQSTQDLSEFIELANNPNYIICLSIRDDATKGLADSECESLQSLGLNMRFVDRFRTSLAAVIDGGSVVVQKDGNFALSCEYEPYANCEIQVTSAGYSAGNKSSIVINGKEYSKNKRGLNIVVYDKTKDEVISSRIFDTWLMQDER